MVKYLFGVILLFFMIGCVNDPTEKLNNLPRGSNSDTIDSSTYKILPYGITNDIYSLRFPYPMTNAEGKDTAGNTIEQQLIFSNDSLSIAFSTKQFRKDQLRGKYEDTDNVLIDLKSASERRFGEIFWEESRHQKLPEQQFKGFIKGRLQTDRVIALKYAFHKSHFIQLKVFYDTSVNAIAEATIESLQYH